MFASVISRLQKSPLVDKELMLMKVTVLCICIDTNSAEHHCKQVPSCKLVHTKVTDSLHLEVIKKTCL